MRLMMGVLAAGQSVRFGGIKQLVKVGEQSMLSHACQTYLGTDAGKVFVTLGAHLDKLQQHIPSPANTVVVEDWREGMAASIRELVKIAAYKRSGEPFSHLLIALADQVAITSPQVRLLIEASQDHPQSIIAAKYNDKVGVPAIFPHRLFSALAQLRGDQGAREILRMSGENIVTIALPEAAIDIDKPQDIQLWQDAVASDKRKTQC